MAKKIYIYPLSSKDENLGLFNPYIDDLINSFSKFYEFVNKDRPSNFGIFDLLKYLGKTDYILFNWIEKLPTNRGGIIQTFFLYLIISFTKLLGTKIIWIMHNKISHSDEHIYLKRKIFRLMLKKADVIITHSSEGINYAKEILPGSEIKVHYFPHPVKNRRDSRKHKFNYDILIWGTISPYKGIDKYLSFLKQNNLENKYKTYIVGKSTSDEYFHKLTGLSDNNITIENRFISDEDLQLLISESRIVLFTYSKSSILSSGVLMDSLGFGANVIGPDVGAFADLDREGILKTYSNFEEIIPIINKQIEKTESERDDKKLIEFIKENSWDKLAEKTTKIIN